MKKIKGKDPIRIAVCVPSQGQWKSGFGRSLALMFSYAAGKKWKGHDLHLLLINTEMSMLCTSREELVKGALRNNAQYILFLDCDMSFPGDLIHRFLDRGKDFISANCTTRKFPVVQVAHTLSGEPMESRGKTGVQEAQHTGLACAMINCEPLKRLQQPLFLMDWIPAQQKYCGEDVYFTQKLAQIGVRIYIDHDISPKVKHIGTYHYGHHDLGDDSRGEDVQLGKVALAGS